MKNPRYGLLGLAVLAAMLSAAALEAEGIGERIRAGGTTVTRELKNRGFDRVEISNSFEAEIEQGNEFRVRIDIDQAFRRHLKVRQSGGTLSIGLRPGYGYDFGGRRPRARVVLPELRGVSLSGSSRARLGGFRSSRDLEIELSGASTLDGNIEAGDLDIDASGSSRIDLSGSARDARIELSGGSEADLEHLALGDLQADLSGASRVRAKIGGRLDLEASEASRLLYRGEPVLGRLELSGNSTISRLE